MTEYHMHGLTLTKNQIQKIAAAAKQHREVKIRLSKNNLQGSHKLPLSQRQINRIKRSKTGIDLQLSVSQLQHLEKTGGFIPLLALLPAIFGGLGAAGGLAGGIASAVSSAKNAQAAVAAQAETERHNREVEAQLKTGSGTRGRTGSGVVSEFVGKVPLIGSFLKPLLQQIGLGMKDCNKIMNGGCVCMKKFGKGLYLRPYGGGLYIGPQPAMQGSGLYLGPER
jgi:hypothetical protein